MEWNCALDLSESELPAVQQVLNTVWYLFWLFDKENQIFSSTFAHLLYWWYILESLEPDRQSQYIKVLKTLQASIFYLLLRNLHNGCSIVTVLYSLGQNREIRELKCLYHSLLALKHAHADRGLTTLMVFRTWHINVLNRSETVDLHYWETVSSLMCSWVMLLSRLSNCYDSQCGCWH